MMKLKIDLVHAHGDVNEERVLLTASDSCNLTNYLIMDTTYVGEGRISNVHRHVLWLPPTEVKKGERVAIYSKKGTYSKATHDGIVWHKIYWNSGSAIWNNTGDAAVLMNVTDWKTTKAKA
jgi:hypothetical protein